MQTSAAKDQAAAALDSATAAEKQALDAERAADSAEAQAESARVSATAAEAQAVEARRQADAAEAQVAHLDEDRTERRQERIRHSTRALITAARSYEGAARWLLEYVAENGPADTNAFRAAIAEHETATAALSEASTDLMPLAQHMPFAGDAFVIHLAARDFLVLIPELCNPVATDEEREHALDEGRSVLTELRDNWIGLSMALTNYLRRLGSRTQ